MGRRIAKVAPCCTLVLAIELAAGLTGIAPAFAQQAQSRTWCNDPHSTDDQTIIGCSALIKAKRDSKHNLAVDYANRGVAYYNKHNYDGAIADYNAALTLDPEFAAAYNGRCVARTAKGIYGFAIADCDQAIQIDPKNASAYNNRSLAKRANGDAAGADADIAKAREMDPSIK